MSTRAQREEWKRLAARMVREPRWNGVLDLTEWGTAFAALLADVERLDDMHDQRDTLRAWVARAVEALTLALKAYVGGASCRACGAPNDAHYSTCPTNALRAVLADAPKEKP